MEIQLRTYEQRKFNDWCSADEADEIRKYALREWGVGPHQLWEQLEPGVKLATIRQTKLTRKEVYARIAEIAGGKRRQSGPAIRRSFGQQKRCVGRADAPHLRVGDIVCSQVLDYAYVTKITGRTMWVDYVGSDRLYNNKPVQVPRAGFFILDREAAKPIVKKYLGKDRYEEEMKPLQPGMKSSKNRLDVVFGRGDHKPALYTAPIANLVKEANAEPYDRPDDELGIGVTIAAISKNQYHTKDTQPAAYAQGCRKDGSSVRISIFWNEIHALVGMGWLASKDDLNKTFDTPLRTRAEIRQSRGRTYYNLCAAYIPKALGISEEKAEV